MDGLDGAYSVSASPDDRHVYVAGYYDYAVAVFSRDPATGRLTFVERQKDGENGVDGIAYASSVTISPDGAYVYATGEYYDNAVAVFSRNVGTGALTFVERQKDEENGVDGLYGASSVTVSPDGAHIYTTGAYDEALVLFGKNDAPTVDTPSSTVITATTARLGCTVSDTGGDNVREHGIYWSTTDGFSPPDEGTKVSETGNWGETGAFMVDVDSLPPGATIYFKAFAANLVGPGYSEQASFFTPAAIITPETLTISEPSGSDTFSITLASQPAGGANVTIPLISSDTSACTVSPASLMIANAAWNTGETVTITAVNDHLDNVGDQRTCTVQTGDPASPDSLYNGITADEVNDVTVTVVDDDTAGVTVNPTSLTISEPSGSKTFTLKLTSQPAGGASVTIPLTSSNPIICTVSPASVTIANANWSTGGVATVTAVKDHLDNPGDQRICTVQTGDPSSSDATYDALGAEDVADVTVTVLDDDDVEISIHEKVSGTDIPHQGAYDLGTVNANAFMLLEFTLSNSGTTDLLLIGDPLVAISGPQAEEFHVVLSPTSLVPPGGTTDFIILFDCSSTDPRSATVTIANTDSDESPYIFTLVANQPAQPNSFILWTK